MTFWNPLNWIYKGKLAFVCVFGFTTHWAVTAGDLRPLIAIPVVYLYYVFANWEAKTAYNPYRYLGADEIAKQSERDQNLYLSRKYEAEGRTAESNYYRGKTYD